MEVKIISEECIKPSLPTPPHLKTYKVSLLDQFMPSPYVNAMLFYPIQEDQDDEIQQRSNLLKQSLSQTLTRFYPLAGKIINNLSIDCNDEGVHYFESHIESDLLMFLSHPDNSLRQKFLPCDPSLKNRSIAGAHVALVQANMFKCGSIVIGISVNHMIADGAGFSAFLKCWGELARGCSGQYPDFTTAPSLFPQNDAFPKELSIMQMVYPFVKIGKVVTKRFVFDSSAIAKLKVRATNSLFQNPTRVEVVSGLIWKCAIKAFRANSGLNQRSSLLLHAVNLRRRAKPPLFDNAMGNIGGTMIVPHYHAKTDEEPELDQLVHAIREAKTEVKNNILETFQGENGFNNFCQTLKKIDEVVSSARNQSNGADLITFTSWITFGLYEVDFGWGKPIWVTSGGLHKEEASPMLNFVLLNDTRCGNGVEAWVKLDEQDMALVQCDEELLAFSSLDPSPLHV